METKEENQPSESRHSEQKITGTGSSSVEDDFEVISDDDDDKILKEKLEKVKNDLRILLEQKLEVTQEREELAQQLRNRIKTSSEFQQTVDWFLQLHASFTSRNETLPAVPVSLPEKERKHMVSIQEEMLRALKTLRNSEKDVEKTKVNEESEFTKKVTEMPQMTKDIDNAPEIRAELDFYRELNQILTSDLNGHQRQDSKFPEVPSDLPQEIQIDLQKYKTTIKHILLQKQNPSTKFVEQSLLVGDSIATSFTNIDIELIDTKDKQEVQNTKDKPEVESQHTQTDDTDTELGKISAENQTLVMMNEKQIKEIKEKEKVICELENKLKMITAEKETMISEHEKQLKLITTEKEKMISELENQLKITTAEKEKALLRLSKMAGAKLTEDNPAISDLSDEYRPLNVAEMFGQLYDNEWTDALNVQISDMEKSEEEAIEKLLEILQQIYILCQFGTADQQSNLYDAVSMRNDSEKLEAFGQIQSKHDLKKVKDFQKTMATSYFSQLEQNILTSEGFKGPLRREAELCLPYIRKCIQLCWMMHIQDPGMELVFEFYPGQDIDGKQLKPYRKSGCKIHYLVWPLLLLHHDGPVVQKGIVQPN